MHRIALDSPPAYSGFLAGGDGMAYNEPAFRHFLSIEQRRAEASKQVVLLVLVRVRQEAGIRADIPDSTAAALFRGLGESVREVDFVGWFREGRIIGAVLTQGTSAANDTMQQLTSVRVLGALRKRLPSDETKRLRVRVVRLGGLKAKQLDPPISRAASN